MMVQQPRKAGEVREIYCTVGYLAYTTGQDMYPPRISIIPDRWANKWDVEIHRAKVGKVEAV